MAIPRIAWRAFKAALILGSLEAIAIGPVPLEWLALMLFIATVVWNWKTLVRIRTAGVVALGCLIAWAALVQVINVIECASVTNCSALQMPEGATTHYPVYIALRFFVILAFSAALILCAKLIEVGRREELIQFMVKLGTVIAGLSIYIYVAQLYGLPDIPRTRLGTDGQVVTEVAFSYAFHRALGTFREPSHLAAWMVLPFFLSLLKPNWRSILIGTVLLLTGSLTGFVAIVCGGAAAWLYLIVRRMRGKLWLWKLPLTTVVLIALALVPFSLLVRGEGDLTAVIADRALPILEYGIGESNRGYIYEYAAETDIPIIGQGLGNSTLYFTQWMQSDVVAGFLSLYLNVRYSLGVIGFAILVWFLGRPLFSPLAKIKAQEAWPLFAAYFAWLVMFSIHAAELPVMFALTYALLATLTPASTAS